MGRSKERFVFRFRYNWYRVKFYNNFHHLNFYYYKEVT